MISLFYRPGIVALLFYLVAFGIVGSTTKVVRSIVLQIKEEQFIEAAQSYGASRGRIRLGDLALVLLAELGEKPLAQVRSGAFIRDEGERRRAAAGHQRGGGAMRAQEFLKERQQRIFFQRRRFE